MVALGLLPGLPRPAWGEAQTVSLSAGDNIQLTIDAHPPGTVFRLAPGVYRGASFRPKAGDQFIGTTQTLLDGAQLLTGRWSRTDAGNFRLDQLPPPLPPSGKAAAGHPMASHPQDLFVDGALYQRVGSRGELGPGKWFFDEATRRGYSSDDLNGHSVELSEVAVAVSGNAGGVVLRDLSVARYASAAQRGAILVEGDHWLLANLTVRQNHGPGTTVLGKSARIEGGHYNDNGQEGISGYRCDGLVIARAEVARNNYAGFDREWEAGGIKIATASGVTYADNLVHDNHGVGIWDDIGVNDAVIRNNQVIANDDTGIVHEISYRAVIEGNRVVRNGTSYATPVVPAGILLQNSSDVTVRDNYVETRQDVGNGITMTYEPRGAGTLGPYRTEHNTVEGNTVVFTGPAGVDGIFAYSDRATALAFHNNWSNNSYVSADPTRPLFNAFGQLLTLSQAQRQALETSSTVVAP